jgi:RNA recognition motif-containing protein
VVVGEKMSEEVPNENIETVSKKKPFWAPKNILYMMGLPFPATVSEIKNFFSDCGEIENVTRQLNDKGRWNGCVFVKFKTRADMEKGLTLDGTIWSGTGSDGVRYIKIQEHKGKEKKKKKKEQIATVFISNLPKEVNDNEVRELFESCGEIKSIRYALDNEKKCRGFGHIEFRDIESRDNAIALNRKVSLEEKLLTIRLATVTSGAEQKKKNERNERKKLLQKEKQKEKKKRERSERGEGSGSHGEQPSAAGESAEGGKKKKRRRESAGAGADSVSA